LEKYTIEMRYIYEIEVQDGQDFGEVLEQSLKTYYTTGVETDNVTLLSANTEVLEVTGEDDTEVEVCDTCGVEFSAFGINCNCHLDKTDGLL
jgi:hypothetical protein